MARGDRATPPLAPDRLERLLEVGRSLVSELDPDALLDRILATASELTGARYAALGILDEHRRELEQFLTRGIDDETFRAIGDLPRGRGVLGVLIDDPRPLRLSDVARHPRSYGFPAEHPPMRSFLGVPVLVRGEVWGNLYLTEKEGGADFDEADEQSAVVLADWAAVAIDNARLYHRVEARREELERAVRGFEATAAVAQAVGAETDLQRVLELIVKRARALVEADSLLIWLREGDDLIVAAHAGRAQPPQGTSVPLQGSTAGEVLAAGHARRVSDAGRLTIDPRGHGVPSARTALLVPLVHRGRPLGVLSAFDRLEHGPAFGTDDERMLEAFAASAATAVAMAKSVEQQRLRHSLEASEAERRRWARELHDATLQGLAGLRVGLSAARSSAEPEAMGRAIDAAIEQLSGEIDSLRGIITDLRPPALDELGLAPAIRTLALRTAGGTGLHVEVRSDLDEEGPRLDPEVETAVYRVVQEALTNVAKHAGAAQVEVVLQADARRLRADVVDDGIGFDPHAPTQGFGVLGMHERVALAGGALAIEPRQPGTAVRLSVPLGSGGA